jgi:hypothetical protein
VRTVGALAVVMETAIPRWRSRQGAFRIGAKAEVVHGFAGAASNEIDGVEDQVVFQKRVEILCDRSETAWEGHDEGGPDCPSDGARERGERRVCERLGKKVMSQARGMAF